MNLVKRIGLAAALAAVIAIVLGFHYVLPHHAVVYITGTEVKRMDHDGVVTAKNPANGPTRDVYFINAETPDHREPRVFRNDDTRFGFPWYFKFDAADQQARAQGLARDDKQLAVVTYYGWRMQMFSAFPNAVSVRPADSAEPPFPWFNTIFLSLLAIAAIYLALLWRQWRRQRRARKAPGTAP
jgi:hypothetical protein